MDSYARRRQAALEQYEKQKSAVPVHSGMDAYAIRRQAALAQYEKQRQSNQSYISSINSPKPYGPVYPLAEQEKNLAKYTELAEQAGIEANSIKQKQAEYAPYTSRQVSGAQAMKSQMEQSAAAATAKQQKYLLQVNALKQKIDDTKLGEVVNKYVVPNPSNLPEWDKRSQYEVTQPYSDFEGGFFGWGSYLEALNALPFGTKEIINPAAFANKYKNEILNSKRWSHYRERSLKQYLLFNPEQLKMYNYIFSYNPQDAERYADAIFQYIGQEQGVAQSKKGIPSNLGYNINMGGRNIGDSIVSFIEAPFGKATPHKNTVYDYKDASYYANISEAGRIGSSATRAIVEMAPAVGLSVGTGGAGAGLAFMGVTSFGDNFQGALNQGYSYNQALAYGGVTAALEVATQYALGGVTKISSNALPKGIISGFNKIAGKLATKPLVQEGVSVLASMGSEGAQEWVSANLDPVARYIILNEKYEFAPFSQDKIESALIGAFSSLALNAASGSIKSDFIPPNKIGGFDFAAKPAYANFLTYQKPGYRGRFAVDEDAVPGYNGSVAYKGNGDAVSNAYLQMLNEVGAASNIGMTAREYAISKGIPSSLTAEEAWLLDEYDIRMESEGGGKGLKISDKQFGKKAGKHAEDFGLDPSSFKSRDFVMSKANEIFTKPTEIREGVFRGQGDMLPNGGNATGKVKFYILGNDVVVTDMNNNFITIMKDGINNPKVKSATKIWP